MTLAMSVNAPKRLDEIKLNIPKNKVISSSDYFYGIKKATEQKLIEIDPSLGFFSPDSFSHLIQHEGIPFTRFTNTNSRPPEPGLESFLRIYHEPLMLELGAGSGVTASKIWEAFGGKIGIHTVGQSPIDPWTHFRNPYEYIRANSHYVIHDEYKVDIFGPNIEELSLNGLAHSSHSPFISKQFIGWFPEFVRLKSRYDIIYDNLGPIYYGLERRLNPLRLLRTVLSNLHNEGMLYMGTLGEYEYLEIPDYIKYRSEEGKSIFALRGSQIGNIIGHLSAKLGKIGMQEFASEAFFRVNAAKRLTGYIPFQSTHRLVL